MKQTGNLTSRPFTSPSRQLRALYGDDRPGYAISMASSGPGQNHGPTARSAAESIPPPRTRESLSRPFTHDSPPPPRRFLLSFLCSFVLLLVLVLVLDCLLPTTRSRVSSQEKQYHHARPEFCDREKRSTCGGSQRAMCLAPACQHPCDLPPPGLHCPALVHKCLAC